MIVNDNTMIQICHKQLHHHTLLQHSTCISQLRRRSAPFAPLLLPNIMTVHYHYDGTLSYCTSKIYYDTSKIDPTIIVSLPSFQLVSTVLYHTRVTYSSCVHLPRIMIIIFIQFSVQPAAGMVPVLVLVQAAGTRGYSSNQQQWQVATTSIRGVLSSSNYHQYYLILQHTPNNVPNSLMFDQEGTSMNSERTNNKTEPLMNHKSCIIHSHKKI